MTGFVNVATHSANSSSLSGCSTNACSSVVCHIIYLSFAKSGVSAPAP